MESIPFNKQINNDTVVVFINPRRVTHYFRDNEEMTICFGAFPLIFTSTPGNIVAYELLINFKF